MSVFEDFIRDELPLRQVVIKAGGDPTTGSGVLAAIGTYYLDSDNNFTRYEKYGSGNTDWREVPTGSSTGTGLQTDSITFNSGSSISTVEVTGLSGTLVIDNYNTSNHQSCKYIINAKTSTAVYCTELLVLTDDTDVYMTQYGLLGDTSMLTLNASVNSSTLSLSATTTQTDVDVTMMKMLLT